MKTQIEKLKAYKSNKGGEHTFIVFLRVSDPGRSESMKLLMIWIRIHETFDDMDPDP